eukprot:4258972-Pleurochrysis_carterae.AAC.1
MAARSHFQAFLGGYTQAPDQAGRLNRAARTRRMASSCLEWLQRHPSKRVENRYELPFGVTRIASLIRLVTSLVFFECSCCKDWSAGEAVAVPEVAQGRTRRCSCVCARASRACD